jgi:hypothetical protein
MTGRFGDAAFVVDAYAGADPRLGVLARPEVGSREALCVEADLANVVNVQVLVGAFLAAGRLVDLGLDAFHEERLARTPVSEDADRKGWSERARRRDACEGVDVSLDPEAVGGGALIRVEPRDQPFGSQVGDVRRGEVVLVALPCARPDLFQAFPDVGGDRHPAHLCCPQGGFTGGRGRCRRLNHWFDAECLPADLHDPGGSTLGCLVLSQ